MDLDSIQQAVRLYLPERYEPLLFVFTSPVSVDHRGIAVVGSDGASHVCVEVASGQVWTADSSAARLTRLLNSSIEQLGRSITAYAAYAHRARTAQHESEAQRAVQDLASALRSIDREALANPESWWSVVVEQVSDGLL